MTVLNKGKALQRILLAVMPLVCLSVVWWSFSTEEDESQKEQKTSGRMSAGGEALTKHQKKPKRSVKTSGGGQNSMKTPVDEAASVESKSAIDAFDPRIDASRLDSRLASCVADGGASPAARVMAAQLCGERGVVAAQPTLAAIAADNREPETLRLASDSSIRRLAR